MAPTATKRPLQGFSRFLAPTKALGQTGGNPGGLVFQDTARKDWYFWVDTAGNLHTTDATTAETAGFNWLTGGSIVPLTTAAAGLVSSSPTAGIGYSTGAGSAVTQLTDKSTAVAINAVCGQITLNNATLNAGAEVGFTVTNTSVAAGDCVLICMKSGGANNSYIAWVDSVTGSAFHVTLTNTSGGNLSEALVLTFVVIKAVAA